MSGPREGETMRTTSKKDTISPRDAVIPFLLLAIPASIFEAAVIWIAAGL